MNKTTVSALAGLLMAAPNLSYAADLEFLCYNNGVECETIDALSKQFTEETGIVINTNIVPYTVIRDQLLNQLQTGDAAPDLARVTDLQGMSPYFLDIGPYVDSAAWEAEFGGFLSLMRQSGDKTGIYGVPSTAVTGPYVNVTMFEDAGVEIPEKGATWNEWEAALTEVKDTLGMESAFALDRTGHRFIGPAMSFGAQIIGQDGQPILVDEGFRAFAERFVDWHKTGFMPESGWPAGSGGNYRNAAPLFLNEEVALLFAGSWLIQSFGTDITSFDWKAVHVPCGDGGCGALLGGPSVVAFKSTDHPEEAAKFLDFLARPEIAREFYAKTLSIPVHKSIQETGVEYIGATPRVTEALNVFGDNAALATETTPQGFPLISYDQQFLIYNVIPEYMTKAINGEMTVDEALSAMDEDLAAQIAK